MYCRKCGKFIDYEGDYCKECSDKVVVSEPVEDVGKTQTEATVETVIFVDSVQSENPENEGKIQANTDSKRGFKTALTATILGAVSGALSGLAETCEAVGINYLTGTELSENPTLMFWSAVIVGAVLLVVALGLAIPAIIMGIKSIKFFVAANKNGGVKPVSVLVLGIVGLALSVSTIFTIITFIIDIGNIALVYPEILIWR